MVEVHKNNRCSTVSFKAEFELEDEVEIVKTIYESIQEEQKAEEAGMDEDKKSSSIEIIRDGNKLRLRIGSNDVIRLRAAVNTWLRLLKIATEMTQVVRECDPQSI
jgi:KEOPS complex subunit Pcc1